MRSAVNHIADHLQEQVGKTRNKKAVGSLHRLGSQSASVCLSCISVLEECHQTSHCYSYIPRSKLLLAAPGRAVPCRKIPQEELIIWMGKKWQHICEWLRTSSQLFSYEKEWFVWVDQLWIGGIATSQDFKSQHVSKRQKYMDYLSTRMLSICTLKCHLRAGGRQKYKPCKSHL